MRIVWGIGIFFAWAMLGGCSSSNGGTTALSPSGEHPANWVVDHRAAFRAKADSCQQCHGVDLKGGIAKVDCFNQAGAPSCHAGGHGPRIPNHPLPFTDPLLHGPAAKRDLTDCQRCHADLPDGPAGSNPRFNVVIGSLARGCEGCHDSFTAHPSSPSPDNAPWRGPFSHRDAGNLGVACARCHGANLDGVNAVGPACTLCHLSSPVANGRCTSCHGSILSSASQGLPSGTGPGAIFPNFQGAHDVHDALNRVTGLCSTSHSGAGIGTLKHFNQAVNVALAAAYNAKTGGFARYTAAGPLSDPANGGGRCLNVSCHGGQTTPFWRTGALNPDVNCTSCHRSRAFGPGASDQFNSYFSGRPVTHDGGYPSLHDFHLAALGLTCVDCHDTVKLATNHFAGLDTPQFEGVPSQTIRNVVNYVGGSCSPVNGTGTNFTIPCHSTPARSWAGP